MTMRRYQTTNYSFFIINCSFILAAHGWPADAVKSTPTMGRLTLA
jgi:hypothetical protein